ncbi:hypothetical protein HN592_01025 [Candidatus Woesearchaeota archaeon]|jgi:hypothetical protein|nr:hypothetical protein [Candidatus Woesearchaeota archaeon]MBT4368887.1 hypothetical protein [Candidatus Woesearchaeota archaeon]MBT4712176.1 hypothetical protein [Candidatus Woesearchaeota archaeon]MBT6639076.1 hypothetical protein [Candidatus Woesearchaeota archaeon]MBT7134276.1 hypothetical protein [Candidatus Woesearchaeota archaeon]
MALSEEELKSFSVKHRKKIVHHAVGEGIVAVLPLAALAIGFSVILTRSNSQELLSPQRFGVVSFLLPIVVVAYVVFLFFIIKDIKSKVKQK